jgi:hypothetical protein
LISKDVSDISAFTIHLAASSGLRSSNSCQNNGTLVAFFFLNSRKTRLFRESKNKPTKGKTHKNKRELSHPKRKSFSMISMCLLIFEGKILIFEEVQNSPKNS